MTTDAQYPLVTPQDVDALVTAITLNDMDALVLYVKRFGAKALDAPTSAGYRPILAAIQKDSVPMVDFMLAHGADPNVRGADGTTPLVDAAFGMHLGMVRRLLEYGADVNAADDSGRTALYWTMTEEPGGEDIVRSLHACGAQLDAVSKTNGWTPLMRAVAVGKTNMVALLIELGARLDLRDDNGTTPLESARKKGDAAMIACLEKALHDREEHAQQQEALAQIKKTPTLKLTLKRKM